MTVKVKNFFENWKYSKIMVVFWAVLIIALITFLAIFVTFSKRLRNTADMGLITLNTTTSVVPNDEGEAQSASSSQDKTINEVSNSVVSQISKGNSVASVNVTAKKEVENTAKADDAVENESQNSNADDSKEEVTEEVKKEISFMAPVSGEIITDYADESLVYSKTLDEWTVHLGIDIKANKTSAVVASEDGTVKSIKNDPRYGLTITISHDGGYETVYSNLLSSDFVKEGDKVTKGQTIGTVGESASFEIAEVPHLHFEMYKDGETVNPTTLLK